MSPTIQMPATYDFMHDRADSLGRYAARVRPGSDRLETLRVFVRDCLALPDNCRDMATEVQWQAFNEVAAAKPGGTLDATPILERRLRTEQVLDALAGSIEQCLSAIDTPKVRRHFLSDVHSLKKALSEVRLIRHDFSENFPLPNEAEVAAAKAERDAGVVGLELDDAFAAIAGCSKEEWLARVQAHKQARRKE